jgi:hypothetical protein
VGPAAVVPVVLTCPAPVVTGPAPVVAPLMALPEHEGAQSAAKAG